jgi:hypothetical protein
MMLSLQVIVFNRRGTQPFAELSASASPDTPEVRLTGIEAKRDVHAFGMLLVIS